MCRFDIVYNEYSTIRYVQVSLAPVGTLVLLDINKRGSHGKYNWTGTPPSASAPWVHNKDQSSNIAQPVTSPAPRQKPHVNVQSLSILEHHKPRPPFLPHRLCGHNTRAEARTQSFHQRDSTHRVPYERLTHGQSARPYPR